MLTFALTAAASRPILRLMLSRSRPLAAVLALTLAAPAPAAELGLRGGGSWGAGGAGRYGGSFHGSLFGGLSVAEKTTAGVDLMFDTQHVHTPGQDIGRVRTLYDAKVNMGALTAYGRHELDLGESFALSGVAGAGVYQLSTFQRCRDQPNGGCIDLTGTRRITTDNRLGVNAGLGVLYKLSKHGAVSPELRFHQLLGGGRQRNPALLTASLLLVVR